MTRAAAHVARCGHASASARGAPLTRARRRTAGRSNLLICAFILIEWLQ
jgi:hypothetical protein